MCWYRKRLFVAFLACGTAVLMAFFAWCKLYRKPSADGWIYYIEQSSGADGTGRSNEYELWRRHEQTGKSEFLEKNVSSFAVTDDQVFIGNRDPDNPSIYRMDADGQHKEWIYRPASSLLSGIIYHNGFLYFEHSHGRSHCLQRLDPEQGTVECAVDLKNSSLLISSYVFAFYGDYFYYYSFQKQNDNDTKKVVSHNLLTGEESFFISEYPVSSLRPCGDYLVMICRQDIDHPSVDTNMYAARIGQPITQDTEWNAVSFPDMQPGTCEPPASWSNDFYRVDSYAFHNGYAFYLNGDRLLCCRPLFGSEDQVTVYPETAIGSYVDSPAPPRIDFGTASFYYQYCKYTKRTDNGGIRYEYSCYQGRLP